MYVDETETLLTYWIEFPPLHVLARGYLGYKPPEAADDEPPPIGPL